MSREALVFPLQHDVVAVAVVRNSDRHGRLVLAEDGVVTHLLEVSTRQRLSSSSLP